MAMQAATVEILIEKAKFEPRAVAVAVVEAMGQLALISGMVYLLLQQFR